MTILKIYFKKGEQISNQIDQLDNREIEVRELHKYKIYVDKLIHYITIDSNDQLLVKKSSGYVALMFWIFHKEH